MKGNLLANANSDKRRDLDFYPTPEPVTVALVEFFRLKKLTIWEPACGEGAMSKVFDMYDNRAISTDIARTGFGEGGVDFLRTHRDADAIITNPPFSESHRFIIHALKQAPFVAMLLKSQYWHAKTRSKLFRSHPPAYILPLTWRPNFYGVDRRGASTMEVIWTVWIEGMTDAKYRLLQEPVDSIAQGKLL